MTNERSVELTPEAASALVHEELLTAQEALTCADRQNANRALDGYVRALGLALQLGPAATEKGLRAVLQAARHLAANLDSDGLSALGPAVVGVVSQATDADVLPSTNVMQAWATVAADVGALIGQVGLALTLAPDRRHGLLQGARARAALLDDATGGLFSLSSWIGKCGLGS